MNLSVPENYLENRKPCNLNFAFPVCDLLMFTLSKNNVIILKMPILFSFFFKKSAFHLVFKKNIHTLAFF